MTEYKVSAWDLNANTLITELHAKDISYSVRLNDSGEVGFKLPLVTPQVKELTRVILGLGDTPFKVLVTTDDYSKIMYSGIAWKPEMAKADEWMTIGGKALPSYFAMAVIPKDYKTTINPATLLQNVVADVQAQPGYNLGILTRQQIASAPPNITPQYPQTQRSTSGQILADITAAITPGAGGVDWYMEDLFVGGAPQHTMVVNAPRAGRIGAASNLILDFLHEDVDWKKSTDATASGNHIIAVGAGSGNVQPVAFATANFAVGGAGQPPRLDQVLQYNHVPSQSQLQTIANGAVQMYGRPVTIYTVTIPLDHEPMKLGDFQIGDDVQLWSEKSDYFPNGLNEYWRIVAYRVDIKNEGVSTVTLTFNRPPVY